MKRQHNGGAILILVLLITSVLISTGTALLHTSELNLKMSKLNSRVKRAFYTAEGAMEEAYAIAGNFRFFFALRWVTCLDSIKQ